MSDPATHERLTALETTQKQHAQHLQNGAEKMDELKSLMVEQAKSQAVNSEFIRSNSRLIKKLTEDTAEVVGAMKTAKGIRKFLMYWVAPIVAGAAYFQDHWREWFS